VTNPLSQEDDFHSAIINMPPEHVLRRRKNFPIRDALYSPVVPEYQRLQQGARVIRKTHWLAYSGLLLVSFLLLISVYNLFSAGFNTLQGLLAPIPGSVIMELTPITELTQPPSLQLYISPTPTPTPSTLHQHLRVKPHITPTPSTTTLLAGARAIINSYYRSINAKEYRAAYALWLNNPLDYTTFARGFVHTQRDTIRFGILSALSDTTVRIPLTVQATETVSHKHTTTRISLYQGYYLVQHQPNRSWRIIEANFKRL
jgi:hypothetical protein